MAFIRINTVGKRAVAEDVPIPGDVRESEEGRARSLLEEARRNRRSMFQELTPVKNSEHEPHPKRAVEKIPEPKVVATSDKEQGDG